MSVFESVVVETVTLGQRRRRPHPEGVGQRNIDHHLAALGVVIAGLRLEHGVELGPRQVGDHVDHAASGVATVERALRAAQDLNPAHIQIFLLEQAVPSQGGVVEADRHSRVAAGRNSLGPDPADREIIHTEIVLGEADVRHSPQQLGPAVDPHGFKSLGRQGRNRDRHVLDGFLAFLSGDDDVFDRSSGFRQGALYLKGDAEREGSPVARGDG
ncbi:hypothetical protein D3C86_1246520 [compost metagenome]